MLFTALPQARLPRKGFSAGDWIDPQIVNGTLVDIKEVPYQVRGAEDVVNVAASARPGQGECSL